MVELKYLGTLPNGREVFEGDMVYRTVLQEDGIAKSIYVDPDGDEFLTFEDGGNALVKVVSDFYPADYRINLR